jgi:hypothetical protein
VRQLGQPRDDRWQLEPPVQHEQWAGQARDLLHACLVQTRQRVLRGGDQHHPLAQGQQLVQLGCGRLEARPGDEGHADHAVAQQLHDLRVAPSERAGRLAAFGAAANLAISLTLAAITALLQVAPTAAGLLAAALLALAVVPLAPRLTTGGADGRC